jgi:hypothetical protein
MNKQGGPPPPFSLTPAIAIEEGVVDYMTGEGCKLYDTALQKFLEEELYDCQPDGLNQFLQSLSKRAQHFGWDPHGAPPVKMRNRSLL